MIQFVASYWCITNYTCGNCSSESQKNIDNVREAKSCTHACINYNEQGYMYRCTMT